MEELARVVTHFSGELTEEDHEQQVCVAGEIAAVRPYKSRSGKDMGFVSLEDIQGTLELVIFNRVWQGLQGKLEPGQIAVARGRVDAGRGEPKILVDELILDMDQIRALEPGPERGPEGPAWRAPGSAPSQTVWPPENGALEGESADEEVAAEPAEEPHDTNGLPDADPEQLDASNGSNMEAPVLDGRTPEGESMVWQLAESRQVTITLRSTGDQGRDAQRLRRIHGMLSSAPGGDHYSFLVYEASRCYHLEFPNSTTRYSLELHQLLMGLLGERAVQVEPLGLQ
jgi:DNA polymerase-3 subunit alpha